MIPLHPRNRILGLDEVFKPPSSRYKGRGSPSQTLVAQGAGELGGGLFERLKDLPEDLCPDCGLPAKECICISEIEWDEEDWDHE